MNVEVGVGCACVTPVYESQEKGGDWLVGDERESGDEDEDV